MTEWISVKDRLPAYDEPVLTIYCGDGGLSAMAIRFLVEDVNEIFWLSYEFKKCTMKNVTHWMPLPEPPEVYDD